MFIDFKPTVTKSSLLKNNTSASDSFAGWPNGMPVPSAISAEKFSNPSSIMAHRTDWWGGTNHPNIGVSVVDPAYCAKTVADMKARGIGGANLLWHGASSIEHKAALVIKPEIEKQGLTFSLCIGSSTPSLNEKIYTSAQLTASLIGIMDFLRTTFFKSPAYLRYNTRPMLLFFGITGLDWNAVRAHVKTFGADEPLFIFRFETNYSLHAQADGCFGWKSCNETWIAAAKKVYANKLIILGINARFDSSHKELPVKCSWGSGDIIPVGDGSRWASQIALRAAHPDIPFTQITTWNDYQEGSGVEPGVKVSATLAPKIVNNELEWSQLVAFDHYNVYISKDGENLMPLTRGTTTAIDLAALEIPCGSWVFVVEAVGKPCVQNIVEATSGVLAWA